MKNLTEKKKIFLAALAALLALALASCGGGPLLTPIGEPESSAEGRSSSGTSSSAPSSSLVSSEPESAEAESSGAEPEIDPLVGVPIPEGAAMEESYLDDAIFVGDSLTYGLGAYQVLGAEKVLASTGINPQTILTSACIEQPDGSSKTVVEAAAEMEPAKIYIMLGANGVAFLNQEDIISWYGQLIDSLRKDHPDAVFYLQSVLPITKEKEKENDKLTNARIRELNDAILQLAADKGIYYLNVAEALADENGCLPSDLSADGMHFGVSTYRKWVDYLLCHTAEGAAEE